jgi:hypothetical protein
VSAIILFASSDSEQRAWVLRHVAALEVRGAAELKFAGVEQGASGTSSIIAIGVPTVESAQAMASQFRRDVPRSSAADIKVLRLENLARVMPMFP